MDPRTVSALNYREDHSKLLWEFRQRVMRPERGRESKNEKNKRQNEP